MSVTYTIGTSDQVEIKLKSEATNCKGAVKTSAPTSTVPGITLIKDAEGEGIII